VDDAAVIGGRRVPLDRCVSDGEHGESGSLLRRREVLDAGFAHGATVGDPGPVAAAGSVAAPSPGAEVGVGRLAGALRLRAPAFLVAAFLAAAFLAAAFLAAASFRALTRSSKIDFERATWSANPNALAAAWAVTSERS